MPLPEVQHWYYIIYAAIWRKSLVLYMYAVIWPEVLASSRYPDRGINIIIQNENLITGFIRI
jgi:hypothetical protein